MYQLQQLASSTPDLQCRTYYLNLGEFMQQRMTILEGVARGEQAIKNGHTFSNQEAKEKMRKWLK